MKFIMPFLFGYFKINFEINFGLTTFVITKQKRYEKLRHH